MNIDARRDIMTTENHRLQSEPPEGDPKTIDRELKRQDEKLDRESERTEQGVDLDPKKRID
jgi:hypothetical protein